MPPLTLRLAEPVLRSPEALRDREWLETDGLGGYAAGTVLTAHSRRYHGLLVANLPPPANGRHVLLSKFEESLLAPEGELFITAHQYRGNFFVPRLPSAFTQEFFPSWTYDLGGGRRLTREIMMLHGHNRVLCRYTLSGGAAAVTLRLRPFFAGRRNHTLMRQHDAINPALHRFPDGCGLWLEPYAGLGRIRLQWPAGTLQRLDEAAACWYREFEYEQDKNRGFDPHEDLFLPGLLEFTLAPDTPLLIAAGSEPATEEPLDECWAQELRRRQQEDAANERWLRAHGAGPADLDLGASLMLAANKLAIRTPAGRPALLAGYPWFEDWGRDTMIALPGCLFFGPRREAGFDILAAFCEREHHGLLPNFINPDGSASYNSVDAALWFFWAVQQYLKAGGSLGKLRRQVWPVMKRILAAYANGISDPPVAMQFNGLLRAGNPETQLTWMDATSHGVPVTPRWGLAVEINALWYNALAFAEGLARTFNDREFRLPVALHDLAVEFRKTFWLEEGGYLADVVNSAGVDRSLRPNQAFAVSLPYSPLTRPMMKAVVDTVSRELLTPCGLRTLAASDPRYCGRYEGGMPERDAAYHQGTVWPWLLGAHVEGWLKIHGHSRDARAELRAQLDGWRAQLLAGGLGAVAEIFAGDEPRRPEGCLLQAWSVGELFRAWTLLWQQEKG